MTPLKRLAICRELNNPPGIAHRLHDLAWPKREQGAYAEAVALADEALDLMHAHGDIAGENDVLFVRTEAALKLKNYALRGWGHACRTL